MFRQWMQNDLCCDPSHPSLVELSLPYSLLVTSVIQYHITPVTLISSNTINIFPYFSFHMLLSCRTLISSHITALCRQILPTPSALFFLLQQSFPAIFTMLSSHNNFLFCYILLHLFHLIQVLHYYYQYNDTHFSCHFFHYSLTKPDCSLCQSYTTFSKHISIIILYHSPIICTPIAMIITICQF